jgi:hypothetical protein
LGYETHDYIGWRGSVKWSPDASAVGGAHERIHLWRGPLDEGVRRSTSFSAGDGADGARPYGQCGLPLIAGGSLGRQSIVDGLRVI